jgi:tetratricopeptide (TPR) repeat protein
MWIVYFGAVTAEATGATGGPTARLSRGPGRHSALPAFFALLLAGGSFTWWALEEGAYFGTVMYPGVGLLAVGMAILAAFAPWRASLALSTPVRLTIGCLLGLAAWSAASALWSPTPDIAVEDAQRIVGYTLAFGLGLLSTVLLGRRMELSVLPVVGAALVAALVTLVGLAVSSDPGAFLDEDGTLEYPLGYRNATAAFFAIAFWPAVALATSGRASPALRLGGFVAATACFELVVICQSRGAILGFIAGALVLMATSPARTATLLRLSAALPAIPLFFAASELFEAAKGNPELAGVAGEMHAAGLWGLVGIALAVPLGFVVARRQPSDQRTAPPLPGSARTRLGIGALATMAVLVALTGNPVSWAGDRLDEFLGGEPDLTQESNRFTFNAGSNRSEVWRVAIDAAQDDPVFGEGGGGFQFRYNREREDPNQLARDAHSVELEMLSELGVVGLLLFTVAIGGAFTAGARARRLGPAAGLLASGALAAGAYWLTHASIDWFWPYPGVTAPALFLLGAAAAPAILMPERPGTRSPRPLVLTLAVFCLTLVPPFLADRLVERSFDTFRADTEQAYADLELARDLNPLSDMPALTEGSIALALDDTDRAIAAFREATRKRPEEYVGHFFLALLYAREDPAQARSSLAVVEELNPLEPRIEEIRERIERADGRRPRA